MAKRKAAASLIAACVTLGMLCGTGCKKTDDEHQHVWSTEYVFDDAYHWLDCEGCGEIKDKERHTGVDCSVCDVSYTPTEDVLYELSADGTYAIATEYIGLDTTLYIAPSYEGVPVAEIADFAFQKETKLTKAVIPGSVKRIGLSAFEECTALTSVVIMDGVLEIGESAFYRCSALKEVVLSNVLTDIESGAFYLCDALPRIVIPRSVTCVGHYAFAYCYSITIYCEVDSRPYDWDVAWDYGFPVVWGYTGE